MATISSKGHFDGQANTTDGHERRAGEALDTILIDMIADVGDLLTTLQAVADKLDLDAGVTDTDYRAVVDTATADFPRTTVKVI